MGLRKPTKAKSEGIEGLVVNKDGTVDLSNWTPPSKDAVANKIKGIMRK